MKVGNIEIKIGPNEAIIGSVIGITAGLMFVTVPTGSTELFKLGFVALISWGAGYATGKKGEEKP